MKKYFVLLAAVVAVSTMFMGCASMPSISTGEIPVESLAKIITDVPDGISTTYYLTIEKSIGGKVVERSIIKDNGQVAIPFGEYHIAGTATADFPLDGWIPQIAAAAKKKDLGIVILEEGAVYKFRRSPEGGKFLYFGKIEDDTGETDE
jgi:hypothetical protein